MVTHHRLEVNKDGKLVPTGKLEEPLSRPPHLRNDHRRDVLQMGRILSRSASPDQPMGQRRPLGNAAAHLSAHDRISLARGAHRPCDRERGCRRNLEDARSLPLLCGRDTSHSRYLRREIGRGALPRRREHLLPSKR